MLTLKKICEDVPPQLDLALLARALIWAETSTCPWTKVYRVYISLICPAELRQEQDDQRAAQGCCDRIPNIYGIIDASLLW